MVTMEAAAYHELKDELDEGIKPENKNNPDTIAARMCAFLIARHLKKDQDFN